MPADPMSSKLETFIAENKINRHQLLAVSRKLEALRPEDRALKLAKRKGAKEEEKKTVAGKPRTGRPLTVVALDKIFAGKEVTGPTKTRVLRAINTILERRKQNKVELVALFEFAKPAAG